MLGSFDPTRLTKSNKISTRPDPWSTVDPTHMDNPSPLARYSLSTRVFLDDTLASFIESEHACRTGANIGTEIVSTLNYILFAELLLCAN